jgi:fermentation-respiration switch protein FrsA (DUF1100 family)
MKNLILILAFATLMMSCGQDKSNQMSSETTSESAAGATDSGQYTFQLSDQVTRKKVTFKNRYGIELTGDLYVPKNSGNEPLPALAISGPFGAVKEQYSGLYANQMAERGFVALAFDPSYTGESGGEPRNVA